MLISSVSSARSKSILKNIKVSYIQATYLDAGDSN